MNGHPLIPTGVVPRLSPAPASETQPPSRAALAIEQLLEMERKAKAWDALYTAAQNGRLQGRETLPRHLDEYLAEVRL